MKIAFTLILLQCGISLSGWAQEYKLLPKSINTYGTDTFHVAKLDSNVIIGTDTLYYNFSVLQVDTSCHIPIYQCRDAYSNTGYSWMGAEYGCRQNGEQYFLNANGDTILFDTKAQLNDQWVFYKYPNGDYLKATISNTSTTSVAGVIDSIKNITLAAFNGAGTAITNAFNNKSLLLSKNHGLLNIPVLRDFPVNTTILPLSTVQLPTWGDLENHNVGDVVQTLNIYEAQIITQQPQTMSKNLWYITRTYMAKNYSANNDTVFYTIRIESFGSHTETDTFYTFYGADTVAQTVVSAHFNELFAVPEKGYIDSIHVPQPNYNVHYYEGIQNGRFLGQPYYEDMHVISSAKSLGSCYTYDCTLLIGGYEGPSHWYYVPNIGQMVCDSTYDPAINANHYFSTDSLIYFSTTSGTYGSLVSGVNDVPKAVENIKTYPNPSNTQVLFTFDNLVPTKLQVFDITGKEILSKDFQDEDQRVPFVINTSGLNNGMYFYRVQNKTSKYSGKIVVQH